MILQTNRSTRPVSSIRMRALDLRGFRSEGFFKKQKKTKKTEKNKKKPKKTEKNKKNKKMQKREKKSKNEQKTTRFLASLLWSRAFIYLHVVLQLGGGGSGHANYSGHVVIIV